MRLAASLASLLTLVTLATAAPIVGQEVSKLNARSPEPQNDFLDFCLGRNPCPSNNNIPSSIITRPSRNPSPDTSFELTVPVGGLQSGSFTNPDSPFFSSPQQLSRPGQIIGQTNVVVQPLQPPNRSRPSQAGRGTRRPTRPSRGRRPSRG